MSYVILKDLSKINIRNIYLINELKLIKIKYKLDKNIYSVGISFYYGGIELVKDKDMFLIKIEDAKSKDTMHELDTFFKKAVKNYQSFLNARKDILIKSNTTIEKIYQKNINQKMNVSLIIKYIKKDKYNYPIIHLLE